MRSPGFGPGFSAWKAEVLPLDYKRKVIIFVNILKYYLNNYAL